MQRIFDRSQLGVDAAERRQLALQQVFALLAQAVHLEHQAAQVPIRQLARLAQESQAAAQAASLQEAWV